MRVHPSDYVPNNEFKKEENKCCKGTCCLVEEDKSGYCRMGYCTSCVLIVIIVAVFSLMFFTQHFASEILNTRDYIAEYRANEESYESEVHSDCSSKFFELRV